VPTAWRATIDELSRARVVLVIGATDAGKTTFTAWIANEWFARGLDVAIVDADVGQSEIGPPATVGLGAVRRTLTRSGDAETVAFVFVGVTSPGKRPWQVADATGRLVAAARGRFERVIVDTSGFIAGGVAAAVKQRKIAVTDPDVVVAIQSADECEHILRGFTTRERPRLVRLPAVRGTRARSVADRRRHREAALARYFSGAREVALDARRVALRSVTGDSVDIATLAPGMLAGLHGPSGETLALGVIERAEPAGQTVTVTTHARAADVASVTIGETTRTG